MAAQPARCIAEISNEDTSLIVAFASVGGDHVDQHFGSSEGFYVYSVTAKEYKLLVRKLFGFEKKDGNEDKLKPKMEWLVGCDVVYCESIGGSATRQLVMLGINPIKVEPSTTITSLLSAIQKQLSSTPEFWLANILNKKNKTAELTERFEIGEDESWE